MGEGDGTVMRLDGEMTKPPSPTLHQVLLAQLLWPLVRSDARDQSFAPFARPRRLARPRTPAFHVGNTGSNPVGDTNEINYLEH